MSTVITYLSIILQAISLIFCAFFAAFGYSQIPILIINPTLKQLFRKTSLGNEKNRIERAISNIGYLYTCRVAWA